MTDERLTNLAMISNELETPDSKIRYDWVGKNICIFENLEKVIFLASNIANAKVSCFIGCVDVQYRRQIVFTRGL